MKLFSSVSVAMAALIVSVGLCAPSASAAPVYINLTSSTGSSGGWNRLNIASSGGAGQSIANLIDNTDANTGISVAITKRFNGQNTGGTTAPTGAAAEFATASNNSGYGNPDATFGAGIFTDSQLTFGGLTLGQAYDFTFFASRLNVSDNRETKYQVDGQNSGAGYLNAAGNTSNVATVLGILPDAGGQIAVNVTKGPNNTQSPEGFYYLGAMKIEAVDVPEPASMTLLALGGVALLRRRR